MKIRLRTKTAWSEPVKNEGKETCDVDGAKLWIGPGNQIYCDLVHDDVTVAEAERSRPAK